MGLPTVPLTLERDGVKLPVHKSTLIELSDIDASELWELRGYSGHDRESGGISEREEKMVNDLLENQNPQGDNQRLYETLNEINSLFERLITSPSILQDDLFNNRQFVFVVGHMRSGGTYLLKNMMGFHGLNLEDFLPAFIHDGCPQFHLLSQWQDPERRIKLLFQLAQLLYWFDHSFQGQDVIFKKRTPFAFAMPLLDELFGETATYVVTIRHPSDAAESFLEMIDTPLFDDQYDHPAWKREVLPRTDLTEEAWESKNMYQYFLYHWMVYYKELVAVQNFEGTIKPLEFGTDYEEFLAGFGSTQDASKYEAFSPTARYTDSDYPHKEEVDNCIKSVQNEWSKVGYEFPDL